MSSNGATRMPRCRKMVKVVFQILRDLQDTVVFEQRLQPRQHILLLHLGEIALWRRIETFALCDGRRGCSRPRPAPPPATRRKARQHRIERRWFPYRRKPGPHRGRARSSHRAACKRRHGFIGVVIDRLFHRTAIDDRADLRRDRLWARGAVFYGDSFGVSAEARVRPPRRSHRCPRCRNAPPRAW